MLKISQINSGAYACTLRLEGRIVGPWVEELEKACKALLQDHHSIHLEMSEVLFVDREGIRLLAYLQEQNIPLVGCSPFVHEQLKLSHTQETYKT
jgi:DNA polymerase III psi subunit